jgi:tryptophanyl-tRNA synthetase
MWRRTPLLTKAFLSNSVIAKRSNVYVTGIQPTGTPHLGNYLGLIQQCLKIQEKESTSTKLLFIADLHSITTGFPDPAQLRSNIFDMAAALLACGVDPSKTILFQQSRVSQHTELCWILTCLQTLAQLNRLPQYKDKAKKYSRGDVPLGLLSYPVLQSADVLLYKGTHVAVGEDQLHHIHLLRDIVDSFNCKFGDFFTPPQAVVSKTARIKSLRDPTVKMSKSDPSEWSRINISDSEEEVHAKCRKSLSDFTPWISFDPPSRPAISNLIVIYAALSDVEPNAVVSECKYMDTLKFKERLFEVVEAKLGPIRREYQKLCQDRCYVQQVLEENSKKAASIAQKNLNDIRKIVGFI